MDPASAAVSGGFGLLSGLFGGIGAQQANAQSAENARNMMEHQYFMSSTAHRREVDDLKAAGLNPILSVNAGASTTQGAMAPVENVMEPAAAALSSSGKEIANYMSDKMKNEIDLLKAQKAKTDKETEALGGEAGKGRIMDKIFRFLENRGETAAKNLDQVKNNPAKRKEIENVLKDTSGLYSNPFNRGQIRKD